MLRPIIGTNADLKIGERRVGMIGAAGISVPDQPFWVMREATVDEWIDRVNKQADVQGLPRLSSAQLAMAREPGVRFFEISTD